jgi:hypothetical protein
MSDQDRVEHGGVTYEAVTSDDCMKVRCCNCELFLSRYCNFNACIPEGRVDRKWAHWKKVAAPVDQPRNRNRAYLAGPMTGYVDYNYPAFHQAAAYYRATGVDIVSPAELHGQDFGKTWDKYLAADLAALDTCGTIILLRGWQDSRGAKVELCSAIARGLDVRLAASKYWQGYTCEPGKERKVEV